MLLCEWDQATRSPKDPLEYPWELIHDSLEKKGWLNCSNSLCFPHYFLHWPYLREITDSSQLKRWATLPLLIPSTFSKRPSLVRPRNSQSLVSGTLEGSLQDSDTIRKIRSSQLFLIHCLTFNCLLSFWRLW